VSGIEDLDELLASMSATVKPGRYVYVAAEPGALAWEDVHAAVLEDEGWCLVTTPEAADAAGLPYDYVGGWISLEVHSSLAAVGLTAAFSRALADEGISCNVLAGLRHDHLVVGSEDVERAVLVLRGLSSRTA
jgi:uncharacterized protein